MECHICGKFYSLTHDCVAPPPPKPREPEIEEEEEEAPGLSLTQREFAPVPTEFAPLYYLRLGFSIIRWDGVSVRRASRDPKALLYGMYSYCLGTFVVASLTMVPLIFGSARQEGVEGPWGTLFLFFAGNLVTVAAVIIMGTFAVAQLGLCHLIAKWYCRAKGTFVSILRPLSLAWPISLLTFIPVVGESILATIAWAAVLMVVFEEVHQIRRLQAFVISYAVNLAIFAAGRALLSS